MSPPLRKPSQIDVSASDSDRENFATDSTRLTIRHSNHFPWVSVIRFSHKEDMQPEIDSLLRDEAEKNIHVARDYIARRSLDTDLGPFKRTHDVSSAYCFPKIIFSKLFQTFPKSNDIASHLADSDLCSQTQVQSLN